MHLATKVGLSPFLCWLLQTLLVVQGCTTISTRLGRIPHMYLHMHAMSCIRHHRHLSWFTELNFVSVGSQLPPRTLNISNRVEYLRTAAVSNVSTRIRKTYPTHPKNHAYRRNNYSTSTHYVIVTMTKNTASLCCAMMCLWIAYLQQYANARHDSVKLFIKKTIVLNQWISFSLQICLWNCLTA